MLIMTGCARYADLPAGFRAEISASPVVNQEPVAVAPPLLGDLSQANSVYRVGPGDVLAISIPGMMAQKAATTEQPQGYRVYSSGKVLLPLVGGVEVGGLTVDEIQIHLQDVFKPFVKEPIITVEILEYKSQPIYLLGEFLQPGVQYLDRPVSLIQGIALGGGMSKAANLRGARVVRANNILPVDVFELVYRSDLRQNVLLQPGDTIYIPGNEQQNVFVFGAVTDEGPIPMLNGRISLLQALSSAGLGKSSYDASRIRVIRSYSPTQGELLVIDLRKIIAGEAMPFALQNGDVVYVPRSGVGDWNQALSEMLPTLQVFSAILQPFVQIKYLTDDDN